MAMLPDVLIIGGGAAAMTAALYSLRAGRSVKLIEKEAFGGQIADSPRVENFPTIKEISGLEWSDKLFTQIVDLGVETEFDEVLSVEKDGDDFVAHCTYGDHKGRSVILATGVKHRHLGIEGEDHYKGKGVSYCAVCDGAFYTGQDTMVIGDANSALQYALLLAKTSKHVDVVTLFDKFFADKVLVDSLKAQQNVTIYHDWNSVSFNGNGEKLESVSFAGREGTSNEGKTMELKTKGAFVAIGQIPDNDRFANLVELDRGFFVCDETMATKTPGVFVAGDCRVKKIRQLTTACNDGAIAALSASNYLFQKD
ncbi:MAG: FAD-dependent oxidoreductase [Bacilli bacterium]|nr:FAD-dependent oxidoreductase [Bacilli bacterium]